MKKNKQPKFEFSDEDVYEIMRTSTTQIAFDYFCNYVTYSADKKTITINVDNSYENYNTKKKMMTKTERIPNQVFSILLLPKGMKVSLSILMENTKLKILFSV